MLYKEAVYERMLVEMHHVKLNIEVSPLPRGRSEIQNSEFVRHWMQIR